MRIGGAVVELWRQKQVAAGNLNVPVAGLHLEIDPRGGEMSIYEKEGGGAKPCVHVYKHMYTRGVWGHAPLEILVFRLSETASGAFSGTL